MSVAGGPLVFRRFFYPVPLFLYKTSYIYIFNVEYSVLLLFFTYSEVVHMDVHTIGVLLLILLLAFFCEWVDSSLGMGYGTILSPLLIILGFPPLVVVPAVLFSQAVGGLSASYFHHSFENANFAWKNKDGKLSDDLKTVLWISSLGFLASAFASFIGSTYLSKETLSTYIGTLVFIMGLFVLVGFTFEYKQWKMVLVGFVSALNKGLSGGGFGPLVTGGQMMLGSEHKKAVGVTTFSEGPICIAGFLSYWYFNGIDRWDIVVALTIGSLCASRLGAFTTKKLAGWRLREIISFLLIVLGALTLLKVYGVINIPLSM